MSTRAFQGNAFQFNPEAFQSKQTVTASGTFGISGSFTAAAKVTFRAPTTLATRESFATSAGLTFFNSTVFGLALNETAANRASLKAAGALAMRGAVAGSLSAVWHASATLAGRAGLSGPVTVAFEIAVDGLDIRSGVSPVGKSTQKPVGALATALTASGAGRRGELASATLGISNSLLNRQQFVNPTLFVNVSVLNFQHGISKRGGGNAARRKPPRQVEPEKRPPTFADVLNRPPPPFRLPAPDLVRKTVRDKRPLPKIKPLVRHDVLAVDDGLRNAFDHRDAMALLEEIRLHAETETNRAREQRDEEDISRILQSLLEG